MSTSLRFAIGLRVIPLLAATASCSAAGPDGRAPIYDESADARAMIKEAVTRAKAENKRVLIQWGGNWCGWCWKLHDLFESDPEIKKTLAEEYVIVMVDSNNNESLMKEMGTRPAGVPYLTFLDADGKKLADQDTGSLEEGDHHVPAKVLAVLKKWQTPEKEATAADARSVFANAKSTAAKDGKLVFVRFSTPSCGWCKRLDAFLETDIAARILAPYFVYAKIDQVVMPDGSKVRADLGGADGGVPWFAFTDAKGKPIVTSDGPQGNIGFPARPHEIEHFLNMVKKTVPDVDQASLDEMAEYFRAHGA